MSVYRTIGPLVLFVPGVFCCQHFSGHLESLTISGLRLDGDLERLWWKLFIHVNSDLSEISQEQLWLLDTLASRGRQSVAKMMPPLWVICIQLSESSSGGDQRQRGISVSSLRSHGTSSSRLTRAAGRLTVPPSQEPPPGYLVGKYGVQAPATNQEVYLLGGNPHQAILPWARYCRIDPLGLNQNARWTDLLLATSLTGQLQKGQFSSHRSTGTPVTPGTAGQTRRNLSHRAILSWARYCRIDPLGLNQNARCTDLLLATGLTGQLRIGQFSSHRSADQCTLNIHRSHRDPVIPVPVDRYLVPVPGNIGHTGYTTSDQAQPVTPGASVRLVNTGQKAQKVQANQCLNQSELLVLNSPVRLVQLEHNVHESLGNMPSVQDEHLSEHSQAFQGLLISDSPDDKADESPERPPLRHSGHRSSVTRVTGQIMSIQSTDYVWLGLMLLTTGQFC